jgi:hypothetical protein
VAPLSSGARCCGNDVVRSGLQTVRTGFTSPASTTTTRLIYDSIAGFHERNMMSNKPHQRPHQKKRQSSQLTRLLVAIIIIAIFALVIALEATGHIIFRGR